MHGRGLPPSPVHAVLALLEFHGAASRMAVQRGQICAATSTIAPYRLRSIRHAFAWEEGIAAYWPCALQSLAHSFAWSSETVSSMPLASASLT